VIGYTLTRLLTIVSLLSICIFESNLSILHLTKRAFYSSSCIASTRWRRRDKLDEFDEMEDDDDEDEDGHDFEDEEEEAVHVEDDEQLEDILDHDLSW
jgi:hypothetical protein